MEITEVRIFLKEAKDKKLKAYATVTFDDCFVVRNIKVIESASGFFVAMPSRKAKTACPQCHYKNELGSKFCNHCGTEIPSPETVTRRTGDENKSDHRDIAHPVTKDFREYLQKKILEAYHKQEGVNEKMPSKETMSFESLGITEEDDLI
jgi:stage V sporulation protein G